MSESRSLRAFLTALALSAGICACGHPATEGECQAILDRIVALELKAQRVTDPAEITKRRNESLGLGGAKDAKSTVLQGCIGKRIADSALACVQSAETSAEITDRCLQ
jgi:hypothetical protein